jgi:hypothetical protein
MGTTGNDEPRWKDLTELPLTEDGGITWTHFENASWPRYYHRDGTPMVSTAEEPDYLQWAKLLEQDRTVRKTTTLYGEMLSTVWLGLDHRFGIGPPEIFETMLFAPGEHKKHLMRALHPSTETAGEREARERNRAYIEKHYPHDNLQLRYSTEHEAIKRHRRLVLQCLIPPRWRGALLGTLAGIDVWKF